jgi:hypothetical protein
VEDLEKKCEICKKWDHRKESTSIDKGKGNEEQLGETLLANVSRENPQEVRVRTKKEVMEQLGAKVELVIAAPKIAKDKHDLDNVIDREPPIGSHGMAVIGQGISIIISDGNTKTVKSIGDGTTLQSFTCIEGLMNSVKKMGMGMESPKVAPQSGGTKVCLEILVPRSSTGLAVNLVVNAKDLKWRLSITNVEELLVSSQEDNILHELVFKNIQMSPSRGEAKEEIRNKGLVLSPGWDAKDRNE